MSSSTKVKHGLSATKSRNFNNGYFHSNKSKLKNNVSDKEKLKQELENLSLFNLYS